MANPQLENGYTRIANELLDAVCKADITDRERRVVLAVIRYTYGFNKTSAPLSRTVLSEYTGIAIRHISTVVKSLRDKNIIVFHGTTDYTNVYSLNKDYDTWLTSTNSGSAQKGTSTKLGTAQKRTSTSDQIGTSTSAQIGTHKIHDKDNIKTVHIPTPATQQNTPAENKPVYDAYDRKHIGKINASIMGVLDACVRMSSIDATIGAIEKSGDIWTPNYIRRIIENAKADNKLGELEALGRGETPKTTGGRRNGSGKPQYHPGRW